MNETVDPFNATEPTNPEAEHNHLLNFTVFFYIVICILGVLGNALVIFVTGFRVKKTVDGVMFLNLAVADFLFTFFLVFSIVQLSRHYEWPFGDFMCKFCTLVVTVNMFASIFLLTAISLDRCLSTWLVTWVQNKRTIAKARTTCIIIWVASICCSIPYCVFRKARFYEELNLTFCITDFPKFSELEIKKSLILFRFVVGFLIPLISITGSYVAIGVRIRRLKHKTLKPLHTILAVISAFFCCWIPFHIYLFVDLWVHEMRAKHPDIDLERFRSVLDIVGSLVTSLAFLNSCLNPFLYVFMCKEYKKKIKQSLLLVLESAFAEEHLPLLASHYPLSFRKSHSENFAEKDSQSSYVKPEN